MFMFLFERKQGCSALNEVVGGEEGSKDTRFALQGSALRAM